MNNSFLLNKPNLRQNASELISDYKSLQKVFKLRFDDNRSHLNVENLSNSFNKQLDLNSQLSKFDQILLKTSNKVFVPKLFKITDVSNNFIEYFLANSLNNYTFEFPFLISLQSDQSRYI